jgi:hypothetical protein
MRTATVLTIGALLAVPVAAQAKTGVEFDKYTDSAKVGEKLHFTVIAFDENHRGPGGRLLAIPDERPLVTFTSRTGRTVRVRASKTDLNGLAYGTVAFPDKGPWETMLHIGHMRTKPVDTATFRVGVGLTQTTPLAPAAKHPPADTGGDRSPWIWILSISAIGSGLLAFAMRRRGRWGAA